MHESEQEHELAAWEARLGAFRPGSSRLDRDRAMFLAGRASVERARSRGGGAPIRWAWPVSFGAMTAAAGCLLVALVVERGRDNMSRPAPSSSGPMAQETSGVAGQDRDEAPAERDDSPAMRDDRDLPAEPPRGFWPAVTESGTLTARSPRRDDADRAVAQFADAWSVEPACRIARAPGSFGPPVGLARSRRPRSYVEHRRMLLEELRCFRETSAEGPFHHSPTGV